MEYLIILMHNVNGQETDSDEICQENIYKKEACCEVLPKPLGKEYHKNVAFFSRWTCYLGFQCYSSPE